MATARYFQGGLSMLRPLPLAAAPVIIGGTAEQVRDRLDAARRTLLAEIDAHRPRLERDVTLAFDRLGLAQAEALGGGDEITVARQRLEVEVEALVAPLFEFEARASARLETALGALERDDLAGPVENVDRARARVGDIRAEWPHLASAIEESAALALDAHALIALLDDGDGPEAEARAHEHAVSVRDRVVSIRDHLGSVAHEDGGTAAEALLPDDPPAEITPESLPDLLGAYDTLAHELPVVYAKSLALLTAVAEAVEAALGLPPLAEPSEAG